MAHALRRKYTHAKHSPETRVGSFAADVQQLSKSGRLLGRPVREAGFRDSSRRQILCGVLNKVLIQFDDFGARQARAGPIWAVFGPPRSGPRDEPPRATAKGGQDKTIEHDEDDDDDQSRKRIRDDGGDDEVDHDEE